MKGVHYFLTRFGPASLRKISFDQKYLEGDWKDFHGQPDTELAAVIEKYSKDGHILMLGCGVASVVGAINRNNYESFHGIDLSEAAISKARMHEKPGITFAVGDMLDHKFSKKYRLIVLSESIYYINRRQMAAQLEHLRTGLAPGGLLIVTIAAPRRYEWIINLIRDKFRMVEDKKFPGSQRHLLTFQ